MKVLELEKTPLNSLRQIAKEARCKKCESPEKGRSNFTNSAS